MCVNTMENSTKRVKIDFQRKTMKIGGKLRLRLLRAAGEDDVNSGLKTNKAAAVRATIRKYLRREQRRAQLARLATIMGELERRGTKEIRADEEEETRPAEAFTHRHPLGAMAPQNTTQYLMRNVYQDMETSFNPVPPADKTPAHLYSESLSPRGVYEALDSGYESCLAFQQRDFEEAFDLSW